MDELWSFLRNTFYMPDPMLKAWVKEDNRLKKAGVAKKDRPLQPVRNGLYPTKTQLALRLLQAFKDAHGDIENKRGFSRYFVW
jgi:hypothetical protein